MDTIQNLRPTPTKPMTKEQFDKKWGKINQEIIWSAIRKGDMTEKHIEIFLDDIHNMYETTGFTETYEMPLLEAENHVVHYGMRYDIIRRGTMKEFNESEYPLYLVRFENGDEELIEADEIALVEEQSRKDWFEQIQHELAGVPWKSQQHADPDHVSYRQLYESATEQNNLLRKLLAEKDKEIESLHKALKPNSDQ